MLRRIALPMLAAVALLAAGCTGDDDKKSDGPLPEAAELLEDAAASAEKITSTHFVVKVTGTVPAMAVENIDGDLKQEGPAKVAAKGSAVMLAFGQKAKVQFVLLDGTLHLDLGGGNYQEMPESTIKQFYDISAVLDPERGVAKLIRGMKDAKTVAAEDVGGAQTYRVDGTVGKADLVGLVPGATADVKVQLWVTQEEHEPVQAAATFPGAEGKPGGTLTVTLSKVNEPVTVEAPS